MQPYKEADLMITPSSSRDRMLAALAYRETDYIPCCFSAFQSLHQQCTDQADFLDRQQGMGLDAAVIISTVSLRPDGIGINCAISEGIPIRFHWNPYRDPTKTGRLRLTES